jgi:hypothetical protein
MDKREERRHHLRRMKAKARLVAKYSWGYSSSYHNQPEKLDELLKRAEKWANHLKMCSCYGCCNPRRSGYFKNEVTRQEWLAYVKYLEGMGCEAQVKHCRYRKVGHEAEYRADSGGPCENGPRTE